MERELDANSSETPDQIRYCLRTYICTFDIHNESQPIGMAESAESSMAIEVSNRGCGGGPWAVPAGRLNPEPGGGE